jgi:hypothetical protein
MQKDLPGTNTLAYMSATLGMKKKFYNIGTSVNVIKLAFFIPDAIKYKV